MPVLHSGQGGIIKLEDGNFKTLKSPFQKFINSLNYEFQEDAMRS